MISKRLGNAMKDEPSHALASGTDIHERREALGQKDGDKKQCKKEDGY